MYILSPFIDMYNGYVQQYLNSQTLVPVVFKMAIILFSFRYMFRSNKVTVMLRICFFILLICYLYWESSYYIDSLIDLLRNLTKLLYPYSILIVLYAFKNKLDKDILLHYVLAYGLIIGISILLTDMAGLSTASYGEDYGYGVKGLFNAGNDIGLSLILCICLSAYYASKKESPKYILFNIIFLITVLRLGSTAGMAGAIISVLLLILQPLFVRNKYPQNYYRYKKILFWIGIPVIIYSIYYIVNTDSYTQEKFAIDHLVSGGARSALEDAFYAASSDFTMGDMLWGISPNELFSRVAYYFRLYGEGRALEVDHLELIGAYGLILGGILFMYPVLYLCIYIRRFFHEKDSLSFWMIIAFLLFVFHGIFAGHAFTSISAMTVLVAYMFIVDSKILKK